MKTQNLILKMLALTFFIFAVVPAIGQNKSVVDTTKQGTVIYTCTMHPEMQSNQPGFCPKCGIELVKKPGTSEKQNKMHKMKMMCPMMNGMSGMENMEKNNSGEKNKIANDSTQKGAVLFTCSMHPEIQSNQQGFCPKCGMALIIKFTIQGGKGNGHKMPLMGIGIGM